MHRRVEEQVRGLRTGDDWAGWLRIAARFPAMSFANVLLTAAAHRDASVLAGYDTWRAVGRQVTKGQRGIPQLVEHPQYGTRVAYVWDISQTTAASGATRSADRPARQLPPPAAWGALVDLAIRHGFAVERRDLGTDSAGRTVRADRQIRIAAGLDTVPAVHALAHELGHVLLHDRHGYPPGTSTAACSGVRRVEADSVAYLVAAHLGLDTSGYAFPHVASWAGIDDRARGGRAVRAVGERITAAARRITSHLDVARRLRQPQPELAEVAGRAEAGQHRAAGLRAHAETAEAISERPRPETVGRLHRIHWATEQFYLEQLPGSWVPDYLADRGFGIDVLRDWRIGHAPETWTALTKHLRDLGYPDPVIESSGLARRAANGNLIDTFRDRAMLPIRDPEGRTVAFIGRAPERAAPDVPKYLNSADTDIYTKGDVLFGLYEGRVDLLRGARPVLVEGPFDAIAVTHAGRGRHVGVAPCGTALTAEQVAALHRSVDLARTGVVVALDGDRAGQDAAVNASHVLRAATDRTAAVVLPRGHDPASLLQRHGTATLRTLLRDHTRPVADLAVEAHLQRWQPWLDHLEGRVSALRSTAPLVASLPTGQVARQVARVADRLDLDHATVTDAVTDAVSQAETAPKRLVGPGRYGDRRESQHVRSQQNPVQLARHDFLRRPRSAAPLPARYYPASRSEQLSASSRRRSPMSTDSGQADLGI